MNPRRLYRSADDRILAGVAGGVAAYFDVDPVIVRIIWFLSIFFTGTLTFWAYLIMIIVVPLEPSSWPQQSPWAPGGGPGSYPPGYAAPVTAATDAGAGAAAAGEAGASAGFTEAGTGPAAFRAGGGATIGGPSGARSAGRRAPSGGSSAPSDTTMRTVVRAWSSG